MHRYTAGRIAKIALLTALALILSWLEASFPISATVPGIKIGLANIVLLYGVYMLKASDACLLMALRIGLAALLFGNMSMALYSLAGGVLSLAGMYIGRRVGLHVQAVSVMGAECHNIAQMVVAALVLRSPQIFYTLGPALLLVALFAGSLNGIIAKRILRVMHYHDQKPAETEEESPPEP